ncbi:MAG: type II toxin-antitoxin system RelE/ParE family toxin [Tepidisphaeraceae bacterium]|jgi:plasmid stabilization system protein ParE
MRRELVVRPEATVDAMEASRWYDERVNGLGTRFLQQVNTAMASIRQSPSSYPVYRREIRRIRVDKFPYTIFFAAAESRVVVLGIFHLYRDPRLLRKMLRQRK